MITSLWCGTWLTTGTTLLLCITHTHTHTQIYKYTWPDDCC